MMSFDHREAGTPEHAWSSLVETLPSLDAPGACDRLLVLAAHPDDETLGAGGLIATAARAGARVTVLIATDGENSHPASLTAGPDDLASRRRREVYAAMAVLAPEADLRLLGLPDGKLADHHGDLKAALAGVEAPAVLVSPWVGDQHPDHAACAVAAAQLAKSRGLRHWQFPIWAWHWARPEDGTLPVDQMRRLPLDEDTRAAKLSALDCHVSQHQPLSPAAGDEAVLRPGMIEHFQRPAEVYIVNDSNEIVSRNYFDDLYAGNADPWGLGERFYEYRRRANILAALTRARFRRAFEPGCASGLLTAELAPRCDEVVAWDIADAAVADAQDRLDHLDNVQVAVGAIPDEWPAGSFDLIVISEIGYYCTDLRTLVERIEASLEPDGLLVACHWRHPAPMHPHTAGAVHAALAAHRHLVLSHVEDDFILQAWSPTSTSVAAREGMLP